MPDIDNNPGIEEVHDQIGEFDEESRFCVAFSQYRIEYYLSDSHDIGGGVRTAKLFGLFCYTSIITGRIIGLRFVFL